MFSRGETINNNPQVQMTDKNENLVELVFRESGSLGMKIHRQEYGNLKGIIQVAEFFENSQSQRAAEEIDLDTKAFKGARIVGVNGKRFDDGEEMHESLKTKERPMSIMFDLNRGKLLRHTSARSKLLLQKATFATESMRQLSQSLDDMEKMNAENELAQHQQQQQQQQNNVSSNSAETETDNTETETDNNASMTPSTRSRRILNGLKNFSFSRTPTTIEEEEGNSDSNDEQKDEGGGTRLKFSKSDDSIPLHERPEFQNLDEEEQRRQLKREAREACMQAIKDHFDAMVEENPNLTYEEWVEELHPENARSRRNLIKGKSIDHRFYVEHSDHRKIWNENLGDNGEREFVPIMDDYIEKYHGHAEASNTNTRDEDDGSIKDDATMPVDNSNHQDSKNNSINFDQSWSEATAFDFEQPVPAGLAGLTATITEYESPLKGNGDGNDDDDNNDKIVSERVSASLPEEAKERYNSINNNSDHGGSVHSRSSLSFRARSAHSTRTFRDNDNFKEIRSSAHARLQQLRDKHSFGNSNKAHIDSLFQEEEEEVIEEPDNESFNDENCNNKANHKNSVTFRRASDITEEDNNKPTEEETNNNKGKNNRNDDENSPSSSTTNKTTVQVNGGSRSEEVSSELNISLEGGEFVMPSDSEEFAISLSKSE